MATTFQTYVPPSTDRSFGSDSNHTPAVPRATDHSSVISTRVALPDPRMVEIGGVVTTKEAAFNAGLISQNELHSVPVATQEGASHEVAHQRQEQVANAEAQAEQAVYDKFNAGFDQMETQLGTYENVQEFTQLVIAGDEAAMDSVHPDVVAGYYHEADKLAKQVGLPHSRGLNALLSEDDRQAALAALISNRSGEFQRYCAKALHNSQLLHVDAEFLEAAQEAGYEVQGPNVIVDGRAYNIGQLALEGRIELA